MSVAEDDCDRDEEGVRDHEELPATDRVADPVPVTVLRVQEAVAVRLPVAERLALADREGVGVGVGLPGDTVSRLVSDGEAEGVTVGLGGDGVGGDGVRLWVRVQVGVQVTVKVSVGGLGVKVRVGGLGVRVTLRVTVKWHEGVRL